MGKRDDRERQNCNKKSWADLDGVLAGRACPDAATLMRLIHDQNPTGKGYSPKESARRYRIKAALQTLLIERFADDLVIVKAGSDEDIVSIDHRHLDCDACHAVVLELGENARSIVRLALDIGFEEVHTPPQARRARDSNRGTPSSARGGGWKAHVLRGDELLSEFDYDGARAAYEAAVANSDAAVVAVVKLLELLVDHLGLDDAARAAAERIAGVASKSASVRGLAAVACARLGDASRVERWLVGADELRSAEAIASLAKLAFEAGRHVEAGEYVARGLRLDPRSNSLHGIRVEVERVDDVAREREERELEAHCDEPSEAIARQAELLMARFPTSRVARAIIENWGATKKAAHASDAMVRARMLAASGDPWLALTSLQSLDCDALNLVLRAELDDLRNGLLQRQGELRREERIGAALSAWFGMPRRADLYLGLDADERPIARERACNPDLDIVERLAVARPDSSDEQIVRALEAFRAFSAQELDDAAAWSLLSPHSAVLQHLPEAADHVRVLAKWHEEMKRQEAADALRALDQAIRRSELAKASEMLSTIDRTRLSEEMRAELEVCERNVLALREVRTTVGVLKEDIRYGNPRAIVLAEAKAQAAATETERSLWADMARSGREFAEARWAAARTDGARDSGWQRQAGLAATHGRLVSLKHELLLSVEHARPYVSIRAIDLRTGELARSILVCAPSGTAVVDVCVHEDRVRLIFGCMRYVDLRLPDLELRCYGDLEREGARPLAQFARGTLDWEGQYVWLARDGGRTVQVANLDDQQFGRAHEGTGSVVSIAGTGLAAFALQQYGRRVMTVFAANGRPLPKVSFPRWTKAVAVHPSGCGFVILVQSPGVEAYVAATDDNGRERSRVVLDDLRTGTRPSLLTSRDRGLTLLTYLTANGRRTMYALADEACLRVVWRLHHSCAIVAVDSACRKLFAFDPAGSRPIVELDADSPPHLESPPVDVALARMDGRMELVCGHGRAKVHRIDAVHDELAQSAEQSAILSTLATDTPDGSRIALLAMDHAASLSDWVEVAHRSTYVDETALAPDRRQHFHHLMVLCAYSSGDVEAGRLHLDAARSRYGGCDLEFLELLLALLEPVEAHPEKGGSLERARTLIDRLQASDEALARGDARSALTALDEDWLWARRDLQLAARRAEAALLLEAATPEIAFERLLLLCRFLHVIGSYYRSDAFLPRLQWSWARLTDLESRVTAAVVADAENRHQGRFRTTVLPSMPSITA
ncbi:MAG: hypothetical protein HOW73_38420 [Polyangiaceae bacterium]|nr:hypothetical protein [Polyangiaceae bacterium]